MTMKDYNRLSDKELVILAQNNDDLAAEILIRRYTPYVRYLSQVYFAKGVEEEDFLQIGLIGLYKGIKGYDYNQNKTNFKSFTTLCIKSELLDYMRFCNRNKQQILNNALPFLSYSTGTNTGDHSTLCLIDLLKYPEDDPQVIVLQKETFSMVKNIINDLLTKLEREVLILRINDYSYKEISLLLGRNIKSVENCIQRVRKKLKKEMINVI